MLVERERLLAPYPPTLGEICPWQPVDLPTRAIDPVAEIDFYKLFDQSGIFSILQGKEAGLFHDPGETGVIFRKSPASPPFFEKILNLCNSWQRKLTPA